MDGSIHENIRELRRERQLTQEQLAEAMGVSGASVSKWENGQCAPDLSVIAALADYFEVSVDALLGHRLRTERLKDMIKELKELVNECRFSEAEALAENILRNYPNSFEAAEGCAEGYYNMYIVGEGDRSYMEKAVEQTKRLFVLGRGKSEAQRYEWLTQLGNQYELLGDWEQAEKYYREGDVSGVNARHLASCLRHQGQNERAIEAFSDILLNTSAAQIQEVLTLADLWKEKGETDKARRLYEWAVTSMEGIGIDARLIQVIYVQLIEFYEQTGKTEQAKDAVRRMVRTQEIVCAPFLKPRSPKAIMSNLPSTAAETLTMLTAHLSAEFKQVAEEEMRQ